MPELPGISQEAGADGLNDIAAILAEQIAASHAAAARCFSIAADEEDFAPAQRVDALRLASRLMHANAAAASAIKRIRGGEFHYHVTVDRIDVAAEKATRRERQRMTRDQAVDARAELARKLQRLAEAHQENVKRDESAA
jgi:hypothetical protein